MLIYNHWGSNLSILIWLKISIRRNKSRLYYMQAIKYKMGSLNYKQKARHIQTSYLSCLLQNLQLIQILIFILFVQKNHLVINYPINQQLITPSISYKLKTKYQRVKNFYQFPLLNKMQKTQDSIQKTSLAECQYKISNIKITQKQQNNNKLSVLDHQSQCKSKNDHHQDQNENQNENENQNQEEQEQQQSTNKKWKTILPPKKQVKLFMIDFAHCDAKKCSGKKLQRFKLLNQIKDKNKKFKGIVLSAFGKKQTSLEDLQYAEKYGVCVVDCSWNRIQQTRQFRFKHQRKLPFVTAGNPVNYGKPYQLSCAQALATALCTIGYCEQAQYIMSKFGWADGFWSLNPLIQNYSKCKNLQQLKIQSKRIEESGNKTFQRNYDLSDPSSQDDD